MVHHTYHLASSLLSPVAIIEIVAFFALMAFIGVYTAKKNDSTDAYFVGGRSLPGWAVGLSLLGASISSITFLALPAAAYTLDYRDIVPNMMLVFITVLAIIVFIPLFRKGNIISVFEYLENRFGEITRLYAAVSFLFLQVLRLCTVMFLVAIPMALFTGESIITVIIITGIIVAFYTVFGGFEAVVWTDVVQTIILLGGGLLCLVVILLHIKGGLGGVITIGIAHNKFNIGSFSFSLTKKTLYMMMIIGLITFGTNYISNQNVVQRYIAAKSTREARKATILCCVLSVPTWLLFFFIGTALFAYFHEFPAPVLAHLDTDQVLPYFILTKIPSWIAGLVIAGCLAAAMSTLSSSISAISSVATIDIFKRYIVKNKSDKTYLNIGRYTSVAAVLAMIIGAILVKYIPRTSMVSLGFVLGGMFGGCTLGIYLLGFFTTISNTAVKIGMFTAIALNIFLMLDVIGVLPKLITFHLNTYFIMIFVNLTIIVVSILFGIFLRKKNKDLADLTAWTMKKLR
ncbi:MAG TPA: sodium/solute symporter [Victivallales bacterium]|nr:sodium/solute symporter [Victivallales bacterium]